MPFPQSGIFYDQNRKNMRPTRQIYSDYTAEDFHVWQTLYERQMRRC
jgi:phenylalanine-4-hydroxylase